MFEKILPARAQAKEEPKVIADLDKLIASPIAFKWNGKAHYLRPVNMEEYMKATEAMAQCDALIRRGGIKMEEAMEAYEQLISSVCDTITKKELRQMTLSQMGALVQLVMDTVTGKSQAEDYAVKKNPLLPLGQK